jgi:hypothetical protein
MQSVSFAAGFKVARKAEKKYPPNCGEGPVQVRAQRRGERRPQPPDPAVGGKLRWGQTKDPSDAIRPEDASYARRGRCQQELHGGQASTLGHAKSKRQFED